MEKKTYEGQSWYGIAVIWLLFMIPIIENKLKRQIQKLIPSEDIRKEAKILFFE